MTPPPRASRVSPARVLAITRRDLIVQVSYRTQFLMQVGQAFFALAGLYFLSEVVGESEVLGPFEGRYFEFALVGIVVITFGGVALSTFSETIAAEQRAGTLEMLLVTPTRFPTLLAGLLVMPMAWTVATMAAQVALAHLVFGARFEASGLLPAAVILALTMAVFAAIGVVSAAVIVLTKRGDPFGALFAQLMTLLGGAIFPITVMPGPLEGLARLFPPFYGLEGLRKTLLLGAGFGDVTRELAVLAGFAVVSLPAAAWIFAWALRLARRLGTLGDF